MNTLVRALRSAVEGTLVEKVPRDHQQPDQAFVRRRLVAAVTLVVGAVLLGVSLNVRPGDGAFYPLTLGLALVWVVGGVASGPLHLGWVQWRGELRRPVISGLVLGLLANVVFVAGALIVREIPLLKDFVQNVLDHARYGSLALIAVITVLNGVAEEIFFRGALFAAIGRKHPVLISTVVYTLATVATGNAMLVFAALLLGSVLGLQRRASGGILAPMITHVTWSVGMLLLLPPLFS